MIHAGQAVQAALGVVSGTVQRTEEALISVYPNPVVNQLTIAKQQDFNTGYIRFFDLSGRLVLEAAIANSKKMMLDVSTLSKGMYLIQIDSELGISTSRFIKS